MRDLMEAKSKMEQALKETEKFLKDSELNVKIVFIGLYGAQNYELERADSDYDFKAVVVPTLSDLVRHTKPVSLAVPLSDGAFCDIKDLRLMVEQWKKAAPNFLEILFSDCQLVTDFGKILGFDWFVTNRERIAHANEPSCVKAMYGMMLEKEHALFKDYPAQKAEVDKYGFSGKQLSHMFRMKELMRDYKVKDFKSALVPEVAQRQLMLEYKTHAFPMTVEAVKEHAALYRDCAEEIMAKFVNLDVDADFLCEMIEKASAILEAAVVIEVMTEKASAILEAAVVMEVKSRLEK
jgi:hypothetical protein